MALRVTTKLLFLSALAGALFACSSSGGPSSSDTSDLPSRTDGGADGGASNGEGGAGGPGGTGITTPDESAGSRLEPIYERQKSADGAELLYFTAWHDKQNDETCYVQMMSDGEWHCAPYGNLPSLNRESYFRDASCSAPVIGFSTYSDDRGRDCVDPLQPARKYMFVGYDDSGDGTCPVTRLAPMPTTGQLALTTVYYKDKTKGTCTASSLSGQSIQIFDSPAPPAEISPSQFVTITQSDETPSTSDRLRASRLRSTGNDGSTSLAAPRILDSQRNEFCADEVDHSGEHRCFPTAPAAYNDGDFANSSCTQPVWNVSTSNQCSHDAREVTTKYMSTNVTTDGCVGYELYDRFQSNPLSTAYYGTPASCTAENVANGGYDYYAAPALPAALDPAGFATISLGLDSTPSVQYGKDGSRLQVHRYVHHAGALSADYYSELYDSELEADCYPQTLEDGKSHCTGAIGYLQYDTTRPLYADAACTDQVVAAQPADSGCLDAEALLLAGGKRKFLAGQPYSAGGCATTRIYDLPSTSASVSQVYQINGVGTCVAYPYVSSASFDIYHLSDLTVTDPSRFVELTVDYANQP